MIATGRFSRRSSAASRAPLVVGEGLRLLWLGLAIGFVGAYFLASMLSAVLYEVRPHDPLVFVGVAVTLFAICLLSIAGPAARAGRITGVTTA